MPPASAWFELARAYLITVLVEGVVLWFGLAAAHSRARRCGAALWLSACTLPVVHFVFPGVGPPIVWVPLAEVFAPVAECALFFTVVAPQARQSRLRDGVTIVVANLASFLVGLA